MEANNTMTGPARVRDVSRYDDRVRKVAILEAPNGRRLQWDWWLPMGEGVNELPPAAHFDGGTTVEEATR